MGITLTPTVAVEYPTPPLSTVTLSTLPLEIDDIIFAPTPSPKIVKSGGGIFSTRSSYNYRLYSSICNNCLYSDDDPDDTRTCGGILKLNVESFPYPIRGSQR